jgi:ubiquinone/menaquinone biosynthesis C-methylase UbiE
MSSRGYSPAIVASSLTHCKLCELADFAEPQLAELMREVYASDAQYYGEADFPAGREYRKYWEVAMTLRAFRSFGVLHDDARVLGVGAGREATIYWLTRHVGEVVATDLYQTEDNWSGSDSSADMLTDPGRYWDRDWDPERLTVRHMNALELDFEDESFDAIFSSSSIEHFGDFPDVRRAVEEMYRVLRPGGVLALATEFRLEGDHIGYPGLLRFDEPELRALLLDGLWWDPASPMELQISDETRSTAVEMSEAIADQESGKRGWSRYPHLVLRHEQFLWTSVHVALVKSGLTAAEWRRRSPELPPTVSVKEKLKRRAYPLVERARKLRR